MQEDVGQDRLSSTSPSLALSLAIVTAGIALGLMMRTGPVHCPNDQSRWDTVWSLVEQGTYIIDGAPWEHTIDKVQRDT